MSESDTNPADDTKAVDKNTEAEGVNLAEGSPGQRLTDARSALGLSLADLAAETRIPQNHLQALENNQPELLPSKPFVSGYLRTCAARLDLDIESLLTAYGVTSSRIGNGANDEADNSQDTQSDTSKPTTLPWSAGPGMDARPRIWRMASMVCLPIICISVMAWAYHVIEGKLNNPQSEAAEFAVASQPDALGPLASVAMTAQAIDADLDKTEVDVSHSAADSVANIESSAESNNYISAPIDTIVDTSATSSSLVNSVAVESQIDTVTIESEADTSTSTLATASASRVSADIEPVADAAVSVSRPTSAQISRPSPGAAAMVAQYRQQDRLVIVVNEDSWIDVTDSVGNRLYKNLARAGRKIEVSGNMPFKLHLGNAPGLALELNGEPFAITNYRDDNSARLTLGSR